MNESKTLIEIIKNNEPVWVHAYIESMKIMEKTGELYGIKDLSAKDFSRMKMQQWLQTDLQRGKVMSGTYQARVIILSDPPIISKPASFKIISR